jgi:cyclase
MGDIFVNWRYPFIDQSSGGSIDGIINGIEKILSITNNETKIIPVMEKFQARKNCKIIL